MVLLLVCTAISTLTVHLRVAEPAPSDPTVTIRRPLAMLDPPIVLGLILVVGLMMPDVRRIRVGDAELETRGRDTVPPGEDLQDDARELDPKEQVFLDLLKATSAQLAAAPERGPDEGPQP